MREAYPSPHPPCGWVRPACNPPSPHPLNGGMAAGSRLPAAGFVSAGPWHWHSPVYYFQCGPSHTPRPEKPRSFSSSPAYAHAFSRAHTRTLSPRGAPSPPPLPWGPQVIFKETRGVEGRGGYFDQYGIIRDVMQNHLLQMMALVAMEQPLSLSAEHIRKEKLKVLQSVAPLELDDLVIGQVSLGGGASAIIPATCPDSCG